MSSEEIYGLVQVLQLYGHGMSNFYKGIRLSARGAKKGIEFSELKRMQIKMKLHYASQGNHQTMKIRDLEKLTGGQYDILNIPFEDEKNLIDFYDRLKKIKVSFAELPDLCLGDGYTQIAYNPQEAEKVKLVVEYFKDKMEIEAAEISLEQYEKMGEEKGKQLLDDLAAKGYNQEMHMDLLQRIRDRNASPEYIPISINLESLLISEKKDRYLLYVPGTHRKQTMEVKKIDTVLLDDGQNIYTHIKKGSEYEKYFSNKYDNVSKKRIELTNRIRLDQTECLPDFIMGEDFDKALPPDTKRLEKVSEQSKDLPSKEEPAQELNRKQYEKSGKEKERQVAAELDAKGYTKEEQIELLQKIRKRNDSDDYFAVSINKKTLLIGEDNNHYDCYVPGTKRKNRMIVKKTDAIELENGATIYTHIKKGDPLEEFFSQHYSEVTEKRMELSNKIRLDQTEFLPSRVKSDGTTKTKVKKAMNLENIKQEISGSDFIPVSVNLNDQLIAKSPTMYMVKIPGSTNEDYVQMLSISQKDAVLSSDGSTLTWHLKKGSTTNVQEYDVVTGKPKSEMKIENEVLAKRYAGKREPMRTVNLTEKELLHAHVPKNASLVRKGGK